MSITLNPGPTDEPAFVKLIEEAVVRLDLDCDPQEVFVIEIKNWFDHKWLQFSGMKKVPFCSCRDDGPDVSLEECFRDKATFPPFTPNRILQEHWWMHNPSRVRARVHSKKWRQDSSWNLQKRVTQFSRSALFIWYSSGTQSNDRGSVMVYRVDGDRVDTWYASMHRTADWRVDQTKGIEKERAKSLLEPHG